MDSSIPPRCIALIVLILAGGFFSGAETAYSYCNRIRMKTLADEGSRAAKRVVKITEEFDRLLVTVLVAINVLHVLTSAVATLLAVSLLPQNAQYIFSRFDRLSATKASIWSAASYASCRLKRSWSRATCIFRSIISCALRRA